MARTLESLDPGTPVYAGSTRVGDVRGIYAEGDSRSVEVVVVRWDARGEDVVIPSSEVEDVGTQGLILMRQEPDQYSDLAPFDGARFPTLRRLR